MVHGGQRTTWSKVFPHGVLGPRVTGLSLTPDFLPKLFLSSVDAGELWIMLLILSYANLQALF